MPFELDENNINFGIENVSIKRTLNRIYDPYSGINLLPDYYSSCHHLEIMTLPSGSTDNLDYTLSCDNPFATTGPSEYGGTGEAGGCRNEGSVSIRYLGGFDGTDNFDDGSDTDSNNLSDWYDEGKFNNEPVTEPFKHPSPPETYPTLWHAPRWGHYPSNLGLFEQYNCRQHNRSLFVDNIDVTDTLCPSDIGCAYDGRTSWLSNADGVSIFTYHLLILIIQPLFQTHFPTKRIVFIIYLK
jgi:hypothetical protein